MPVYEYECPTCGEGRDEYRAVDARNDAPVCCGLRMARVITPHRVIGEIQPYQSMVDGSIITSRKKHRDHLRQHGCIEVGTETKALMGLRRRKGFDRDARKRQIADVLNNR